MIRITCDSTCDLTRDLYEMHDITVVSMGVTLGDRFGHDGVDLTADEIYAYVEENGKLPTTSAISVGEYTDAFAPIVNAGDQVLHISLSSELSSSYQNACIAASDLDGVRVVNSKNLSTGSGLLVLLASDLVKSGVSLDTAAETLTQAAEKLDVSFVIQTLDYLRKGGRCSAIAALGANLMKLRPEIEVKDGKMGVAKKYRGSIERSVSDYIKGRLQGRDDLDLSRIFVTHSGVPEEVLTMAVDLVKELQPFEQVYTSRAGCTISSHCGPGTLGVLFLRK